MRVVLDTSVFISALRSPRGASAEVVRLILRGELEAAVSTALLLEYEAVGRRAEHLRVSGLTAEEVVAVVDALAATMLATPIRWRIRPGSVDPDDDFVIEAAASAGADAIVTNNPADIGAAAMALGIRVISPSVLLFERRSIP